MGCLLIALLLIILICARLLPLGKVSEESINKCFQEKLSSKLKDDQEELNDINIREPELKEELKTLKEL